MPAHHAPIRVVPFSGPAANAYLDELAALRIEVFREYPYRYAGSLAYEAAYLSTFVEAEDSIVVIAFAEDRVVGASTGLPLRYETPELQAPWQTDPTPIETIFYCSESVLRKDYRGRGIGVRFFEERERWAQQRGYRLATFCAVIRPPDDPHRPPDYVPLDAFWRKRGYHRQEGYIGRIAWPEIGEEEDTEKELQFWAKGLV
jgi:GNAT superfamily N-acetyltransferase